ncbi:hypothetical protein ACM66B_003514 [Microbotryomycetes sp. NB124-2]
MASKDEQVPTNSSRQTTRRSTRTLTTSNGPERRHKVTSTEEKPQIRPVTRLQPWPALDVSPDRQKPLLESAISSSYTTPPRRGSTRSQRHTIQVPPVNSGKAVPEMVQTTDSGWQTPPIRRSSSNRKPVINMPSPIASDSISLSKRHHEPVKSQDDRLNSFDLIAKYGSPSSSPKPQHLSTLPESSTTPVQTIKSTIKTMSLKPVEPKLQARFDETDFDCLQDEIKWSALWRTEFIKFGYPTWEQCSEKVWKNRASTYWKAVEKNKKRPFAAEDDDDVEATRRERKKVKGELVCEDDEPSWAKNGDDVQELWKQMSQREQFVAVVWIRDILSSTSTSSNSNGSACGGVRQKRVRDVDMWIVGKEFPVASVMILGIVVGTGRSSSTGRTWYYVDDGTGIIECNYAIPQPRPTYTFSSYNKPRQDSKSTSETDTAPMQKTNDPESNTFEEGTLVKVIGSLNPGEPWQQAFRPVSIDAFKIERVKDGFSGEAEHHLLVKRLHRDVYDQTFDLRTRLEEIRTQQTSCASSQPYSSSVGDVAAASQATSRAPRKVRFRRPNKLDLEDVTIENFVAYVRHHLRNEFVDEVELTPSSSAIVVDVRGMVQPQPLRIKQHAIAFKIEEVRQDKHLMSFATRLAHKNEIERHYKKERLAKGFTNDRDKSSNVWVDRHRSRGVAGGKGGDVVETKVTGSFGGSALLLTSVSSVGDAVAGNRKSNHGNKRKTVTEDEQVLKGDKLSKAVDKLFEVAVRELFRRGDIVLSAKRPRQQRATVNSKTDRPKELETRLPDEPIHAVHHRKPNEAMRRAPQRLNEATPKASQSTDKVFDIRTGTFVDEGELDHRHMVAPVKIEESRLVWDSVSCQFVDEAVLSTKEVQRRQAATSNESPQRVWDVKTCRFVDPACAPSVTIKTEPLTRPVSSQVWDAKTYQFVDADCWPDRASSALATTATAGKDERRPVSSTRFDHRTGTFIEDESASSRHANSASPRAKGALSATATTAPPSELASDVYELVTSTALSQKLLNILTTQCHRPLYQASNRKTAPPDPKRVTSLNETSLRKSLWLDQQWQQVARFSSLVGQCLLELVQDGKVRQMDKDGSKEFAPVWQ